MPEDVRIAEAIRELREQLEQAQAESAGSGLRFRAKSVEIEMSVVFKTDVQGSAGLKAWVLDLSAKAGTAHEASHKVKLVLEPVMVEPGTGKVTGDVVVSATKLETEDQDEDDAKAKAKATAKAKAKPGAGRT